MLLNSLIGSMELFINGLKLINTIKFNGSSVDLKPPVHFGNCKMYEKLQFSGQITDLGIWNSALSFEEVQEFSLNCNSQVVKPEIKKVNCTIGTTTCLNTLGNP